MIGRVAGEGMRQGRRRTLVVAAYTALLAYTAGSLLVGDTAWFWPSQIGWVTAAGIYIAYLRPATQDVSNRDEDDLDERQSMVRNRAYSRAYRILTFVIMLPGVYVLFAVQTSLGLWLPHMTITSVGAMFIGFVWVSIMLPASIIAWNEPDPEPGE